MTRKQQNIMIAGMGIVLLLLVVRPVMIKLNQTYKIKKDLQQKIGKLQVKLSVLEGIDRVLIEKRVKKMEMVFPSEKPIVALMGNLSYLADEYGLSFGGISLKPGSLVEEDKDKDKVNKKTDGPGGLKDLSFKFQVVGDFASIIKFMQALENTAPLMKVEEIALAIKTNPLFNESTTVVLADIQVAAYYQSPPKTIGSVISPVKLLSREEESYLNKLINFQTFDVVLPVAQTGKVDLFQ